MKLHETLPEGEPFIEANSQMATGYRSGVETFKAAGFDSRVRGMAQ